MEDKKIRVAIAHGDTNGIGYELIFKTFASAEILDLCTPIIYGSPKVAAYHRKALDIQANFSIISNAADAQDGRVNLLTVFEEELKVELGMPTDESCGAAIKALDRAVTDYKDGLFDVLVTAPVCKEQMHRDGLNYNNENFVELCLGDGRQVLPITIADKFRVASVAGSADMRSVVECITRENVEQKLKLLCDSLAADFRVSMGRVAVLSLNPNDHSTKHGREEQEVIVPAIASLSEQGYGVFGPYRVDDFFAHGHHFAFDAIMAMYHDQVMGTINAVSPDGNTLYLAGMPLVLTAPCLTPGFDIAGQNKADIQAMRNAIYHAIDIYRNRITYAEPMEHPLPKLYHEKRDESEKVRFAVSKKREHNSREKDAVQ